MITYQTKESVVKGQTYLLRNGERLYIEAVSSRSEDRCIVLYRQVNNQGLRGSLGELSWYSNGKYNYDSEHPNDFMSNADKPNFNGVEDITSMFKFMQQREKELRA